MCLLIFEFVTNSRLAYEVSPPPRCSLSIPLCEVLRGVGSYMIANFSGQHQSRSSGVKWFCATL